MVSYSLIIVAAVERSRCPKSTVEKHVSAARGSKVSHGTGGVSRSDLPCAEYLQSIPVPLGVVLFPA